MTAAMPKMRVESDVVDVGAESASGEASGALLGAFGAACFRLTVA